MWYSLDVCTVYIYIYTVYETLGWFGTGISILPWNAWTQVEDPTSPSRVEKSGGHLTQVSGEW